MLVVRDGQQAVDFLLDPGQELPSVVLLDLNLPKLGGLEVLERIRANPRTHLLPVAVLTSSDEEQDRVRSYQGGANSFVRKPVDFGSFAETVARMGVYWALLNEDVRP